MHSCKMRFQRLSTLTVLVFGFIGCTNGQRNPDTGLNVLQLITKYGYPLERHPIKTEDGYIIETHRIPHGRQSNVSTKGPLLVMHGLTSSSADFCNNGDKSFAFIAADLGYDVWLANARGNRWSRKHVTLNPDRNAAKFWAFSWNEIGMYDLPANIDYILNQTHAKKLFYVGHSQGTTSFFVMGSERPKYNDKIKLAVMFAPVAYSKHMRSPYFQLLSQFETSLTWLAKFVGVNELAPSNELLSAIGGAACQEYSPFKIICRNIFFLMAGYDSKQFNETQLPVYVTNVPAGSATRQSLHYAQGIKTGEFRKWDYHSIWKNLKAYKSFSPPKYNLKKVTAPVALYTAPNDLLVSATDVDKLRKELPNIVIDKAVEYQDFSHLDFIIAIDVVKLVYNQVFEAFNNY